MEPEALLPFPQEHAVGLCTELHESNLCSRMVFFQHILFFNTHLKFIPYIRLRLPGVPSL